MTFKEWPCSCSCGFKGRVLAWDNDLPPVCPACNSKTTLELPEARYSHGIIPDDIPGGIEIRHGLVNADGSPRKFYSRTDIKRACNEGGWVHSGDTPKPYRVQWSGIKKEKW